MTKNTYDYIVVGGGSSGCIVAARLAEESGATVLLLEAGDSAENNPDTLTSDGFKYCFANDNVMWDRMSESQSHCGGRSLYAGTGTGMGGSGSVNGMVYTRGDKHDYAQWPQGWHWSDIDPIFKQLEARLDVRYREGTEFTENALDAAEEIGMQRKNSMNDGNMCGFMGYNDMNFKGETRRSSYVAFLKDQQHSSLTVQTKAQVQKILFNVNKHATAISYVLDGKAQQANASKEIILCAGALETPKLLMLSGVGPKEHLASLNIPLVHDVPSIGENLHDHPNVCMFLKGRKPIDFAYPQVYGFDRMNPALELPEGQADTCFALLSAPITVQQSMYRMVPATILPGKLFYSKFLRKVCKVLINTIFAIPKVKSTVANVYGIVVILGKPTSRGNLKLRSANPADQAIINPAYYATDEDKRTMLNGVITAKKMAKSVSLKAWGSQLMIPSTKSNKESTLQRWIERASMTTFHFCGTCSMGEDDKLPVTTDLKLKGLSGLRIADASVIPVIPVSALNAPSMLVGYRAADFILAEQA